MKIMKTKKKSSKSESTPKKKGAPKGSGGWVRGPTTKFIARIDLDKTQKRLIAEFDRLTSGVASELQELYANLREAMGDEATFEHPETGVLYTICKRGDLWFHRLPKMEEKPKKKKKSKE